MRLLIFLLVLTFAISTFGRKPFRPWAKGKACSSKVIKFCKKKCPSGKTCENLNKRNPNNKTKKKVTAKKKRFAVSNQVVITNMNILNSK